mmetsp:Transcript_29393/g.5312  ORF Transcript_29393/g.5312 Transcript_29393/m.5312 type:complete len:181 (+) Transcript_29393:1053-1595(+)
MLRNPKAMKAKFIGLFLTIIYTLMVIHNLGKDYESYLNRIGLLFLTAVNLVLMQNLALVTSFPLQKAVFMKEYRDNMYGVVPFLTSKFLVHFLDEVMSALVYSLFIYWIVGLNTESDDKWFIFYSICLLSIMIGTGLGILIGTIFSEPAVAVNMGGLIAFPLSYFCGYLRNFHNIPDATS